MRFAFKIYPGAKESGSEAQRGRDATQSASNPAGPGGDRSGFLLLERDDLTSLAHRGADVRAVSATPVRRAAEKRRDRRGTPHAALAPRRSAQRRPQPP